jgi:hypothetical protein
MMDATTFSSFVLVYSCTVLSIIYQVNHFKPTCLLLEILSAGASNIRHLYVLLSLLVGILTHRHVKGKDAIVVSNYSDVSAHEIVMSKLLWELFPEALCAFIVFLCFSSVDKTSKGATFCYFFRPSLSNS